jgi:hypothetical protein
MNTLSKRYVGEVVDITKDCDIGKAKERAVVVAIDGLFMTLVFPMRISGPFSRGPQRQVQTGADYRFLMEVLW